MIGSGFYGDRATVDEELERACVTADHHGDARVVRHLAQAGMHCGLDGDSERLGFRVAACGGSRGLYGQTADHGHKLRVAWNGERELECAGVHATRRTG